MLNSDGVYKVTPSVVETLKDKHPEGPGFFLDDINAQAINFSSEEVAEAIKSFPNGSSGGPYGLVEKMLKDMINDAQLGNTLLTSLAKFCSQFCSGKMPIELACYYASARLIPLIKKDNGVRPMAVGDTLRRLVCKLGLKCSKIEATAVLYPHQLGVGVQGEAEAIIHSVAAMMENLKDNDVILQIDFTNAFNLVSREKMMELIRIHLPILTNLVYYLYSRSSNLVIGDVIIESCSGVQQGCPLAPLLFSLVLRELTEEIANLDINVNQWFLDDGHIVGKGSEVLKALEIIEERGIILGLFLNLSKCVVLGKHTDNFPEEVKRSTAGLVVLGAPVGTSEFVENEVRKIVKKATDALLKSRELNDPQSELLLLRTCSGAQKLT
jgi:hypothetical protein